MIWNHILEIEELNLPKIKKGSDFNFFSAIVSGKREHIEFYHSNFIAFLLSENENHGMGNLFLKNLLNELKEKNCDKFSSLFKNHENYDFTGYIVEREKFTAKNGNIDIHITSKEPEKWTIFIENKMRSNEGYNQVNDYYEWHEQNHNNWPGIYLTKNGDYPESIRNNRNYDNKIINISYSFIIRWLELCLKGFEDANKRQIKDAIGQYMINILKTECQITMEEKSVQLIEVYKAIIKDPENLEKIKRVVKDLSNLNQSLESFILHKRKEFLSKLADKLIINFSKNNFNFITREFESKNSYEFEFDKFNIKIKIAQAYPQNEDGGRGLWCGVYELCKNKSELNFNEILNKLGLTKNWFGIDLNSRINDFSKDTDEGSSLIIDERNHEAVLDYVVYQILNKIDLNKLKSI